MSDRPIHSLKVRLSHLKVRWRCGYYDEDVRISHSRMREPTTGRDMWVPNYGWDLPQDDLTVSEARRLLQRLNAEAKRAYQAEKQRRASRKHERMVAHREHDDPAADLEIETEHYDGAAHSRIMN